MTSTNQNFIYSSFNCYIFTLFRFFSRVIQSSHPVCNTIMLFGVITCLVSVVLLGIDGRFVNPDTYPKVSNMIQLYLSHHIIYHNTLCSPLFVHNVRRRRRSEKVLGGWIYVENVYNAYNESQHDLFGKEMVFEPMWALFCNLLNFDSSFNVPHHIYPLAWTCCHPGNALLALCWK